MLAMNAIVRRAGVALVSLGLSLLPSRGVAETQFFRFASPAASTITSLGADGTVSWSCEAVGATGRFQRATSLAEGGGWVDYVQVEVSDATMSLRLFDPHPPEGMVLIPAGSFQMGDSFSEGSTVELPVHSVYVSAFYMDKYEVT